jgi:hypothetical protein
MPPAVAALNIGVRLCRGEACGDILEAMARVAPLPFGTFGERLRTQQLHRSETYLVSLRYLSRLAPGALLLLLR